MLIRQDVWLEIVRGDAAAERCVIRPVNEFVLLDTEHPAFPRHALQRQPTLDRPRGSVAPVAATTRKLGPGGHLKRLLAKFGINATEGGCKCNSRAAEMDRHGCEWVEANIDTVVGWLREEAQKRGLPFVDALAKMLVREAVRRARKDAAADGRGSQRQD